MKKMILGISLLMAGTQVFAQIPGPLSEEGRARAREAVLNHVLHAAPNKYAAKPTAIQQRLTGIKLDDNINNPPFESQDTTMIFYSGLRSSQFNYGTLQYNAELQSFNEPLAEAMWISPALADEINADSVLYERDNYSSRYIVEYHNGNLKKNVIFSQTGNTELRSLITYDNNNHATRIDYSSASNQPPFLVRTLTYNPGYTRILTDTSMSSSENFYVWAYSYYPNDKIKELECKAYSNAGVVNNSKFTFSYNANNAIETVKEYLGDGGSTGYMPVRYDSFTYENNNPIFKGQYTNTFDWTGEPSLAYFEIKVFNTDGLPDTVYFYGSGPFTPGEGTLFSYNVIEYNDFDNPVSQKRYEPMATYAFRIYKYYYQDYETTIDEITDNRGQLVIYPNPVRDHFTIEWKGGQVMKNVLISITDSEGKIIQRMKRTLNAGNNEYTAKELAQGNYLLIIEDENGKRIVKKLTKL